MKTEKSTNTSHTDYFADVLGDGFNRLTRVHAPDYEGAVISTLIRRHSEMPSKKAMLYIHGFNDYFFQDEMAKKFNAEGYHFYALDLRKYGRSHLSHQKLNNVRSLLEYDEEITLALQIMRSENNNQTILMGHSTGGLIVTNYAKNHENSPLFNGVICNSPFYEFNLSLLKRNIGIPVLSILGKYFPNKPIASGLSKFYGYSLHKDKFGEWNYSLIWKPNNITHVNFGFIRAIHKAQKIIKKGITLKVPLLVMHSRQSVYGNQWSEKFKKGDAVLNHHHIHKYAHHIKGDVTNIKIENGMHDLFLSKKTVRDEAYQKTFEWMRLHFK